MPKFSETPLVDPTARVTDTVLGRFTGIAEGCRVTESTLGDYSYLMEDCIVWGTDIGKFANIASTVRLNATNHPVERATLHHFTYRAGDYFADAENEADFFAARRARRVTIGHDVWIGHGATVLPGVSIGNGAVIGSGAVVTKNVPPYAIHGGVPAKLIRQRFREDVGQRMDRLGWWDWPHDRLRVALDDFRTLDAEAFLDRYEA